MESDADVVYKMSMNLENPFSNHCESNVNVEQTAPNTQQENTKKYIEKLDADAKRRLDYLLDQAEIYTHFLSDNNASKSNDQRRAKEGSKLKRRKMRYNAELEDSIEDTKSVYLTASPAFIVGEMRDYQIDGLNWLVSLSDNGINGILADDMGLGKTLQSVSLLGYLKHFKKINGPHLIVAPLSTVINWKREFEKFCPSMNVFILAGVRDERRELLKRKLLQSSWDVCITSYDICRIEQSGLRKVAWRYIVIDEAHRIKNEQSLLSVALRRFSSTNRLLLTGTPLQNDLHELWSLLNYLLPDIFNSAADFDKWFDPNECLGDDDMVNRLHRILKPFMLRRIKSEVEKSLLPKIETKIFVGLSKMQREWYRKVLLKDITILRNGWEAKKMRLENLLMHLRKAASHPYLFEGAEEGPPFVEGEHIIQNSGKMIILDKLLTKLKAQGSKVLIFSQFKIVLNILEDYCTYRNHEYFRLDGDTKYETRSANMDAFNAGNSSTFIFMISTRAGGLGITLTGADCVIVFDSDWNPQVDLQAIDRAHRIGQTKQVRVFRLITENTVDEKIVEVAERKMRLDRLVIQQGRMVENKTLSAEERKAIISHGANYVLSSADSDLIDEDIDKILARSEVKTAELKSEYDKLGAGALQNFKIETPPTDFNTFEGVDFRELRKVEPNVVLDRSLRRRKPIKYTSSPNKFDELDKLLEKNYQLYQNPGRIRYLLGEKENETITTEELRELRELRKSGFVMWSEAHYLAYLAALCKFGRENISQVSQNVKGKTRTEVMAYDKAFWERGPTVLHNFDGVKSKVERHDRYRQQRLLLEKVKANEPNPVSNLLLPSTSNTSDENRISTESSGSSFNYSSVSSASYSSSDTDTKKLSLKEGVLAPSVKTQIYSNLMQQICFSKPKPKPEWLSPFPSTSSAATEHALSKPTASGSSTASAQRPVSPFSQPKSRHVCSTKPEWLTPFATIAPNASGQLPLTGPAAKATVSNAKVNGVPQNGARPILKEPRMNNSIFFYD